MINACFLSEFAMVQEFEETFEKLYSDLFSRVLEFDSENGIADIVLYKKKKNWEHSSTLGMINPRWAYTLRSLPYRKYFTIEEFQALTRTSSRSAKSTLTMFKEAGYCDISNLSKKWIKHKQPMLLTNNVVAIEAKLSDWKRAVKQARRYQDYANESWVLLEDKSKRAALKNIQYFEKANIGLATINIEGDIERHWSPSSQAPRSEFALWYMNAKLARDF